MEEYKVESRVPTTPNFPSKFTTLPAISLRSPQPTDDNQIVPWGGTDRKSGAFRLSSEGMDSSERLRNLETRLGVTEKSNRALLEEVVRLQSELKTTVRRNDDVLREERQSRQQLENTLRSSMDLLGQVTSRLKRTEDRIQEERTVLNDLVSHSKNVEQSLLGNQQDMVSRRDYQASLIDELKAELEETTRAKGQLERLTYQLADDMRSLKSKVDNQAIDISQVANDMKARTRRIEDDHRQTVQNVRKQTETQNQVDMTTTQLRAQVESRLSEVRDVLLELRNRQDGEVQERRMAEQQFQVRINDIQSSLLEQARKRDEAIHALDTMAREKEHAAETERLKLQNHVAEMVEDVSKRILAKEIKLREESQEKFLQIEKAWHDDQQRRQDTERAFRAENERKWEMLKKAADDEIANVRDAQKLDRGKYGDTLKKIDESVGLLEQQISETKRQMDKVITAEIRSRKQHERDTRERVDHLQDKIGVATSTLQEAIGGITSQLAGLSEKVRRDLTNKLDERQAAALRQLNDLDTRLLSFGAKLDQLESKIDAKVSALDARYSQDDTEPSESASAALAQNMREKMESIIQWQELTGQNIKEIQKLHQTLPSDIYELNEKLALHKNDTSARIQAEIEQRVKDVEGLRRELEKMKALEGNKEATPTMKDIDNCQGSIRKLAESIQTVKTVLGMRIQSEQKSREEEVKSLQEEVAELRAMIEPLLKNSSGPRLFVKPEGDVPQHVAEGAAPNINKWSIYTAVRWLAWKSKWMYVKWKKAHERSEPPSPEKASASPRNNDDDKSFRNQPEGEARKPPLDSDW